MTETAIQQIVQKQRAYFQTGATLDLDFRLQALERLSACIQVNEQAIHKALWLRPDSPYCLPWDLPLA